MIQIIRKFSRHIISFRKFSKQIIVLTNDVVLCVITFWFAFFLRLDKFIFINSDYFLVAAIAPALALPIFGLFGVYRTIGHSNLSAMFSASYAMIFYGLLYFSIVNCLLSIFVLFQMTWLDYWPQFLPGLCVKTNES